MISFSINAFVDVPQAHLAYEAAQGRTRRRFWQADVQLGTHTLTPSQLVRSELLIPLLQGLFASAEQQRLGVALSHYHAALRDWTPAGQPLALMHLYPALEALGGAVERAERTRLTLASKEDHAQYRGIDVAKSNWREVLLGCVRRDLICKGDQTTYSTARKTSNGLEHGFMDMPSIRAAAEQVTPKLFGYVRDGVLDLLNLETDVRDRLGKMPVLDGTPFHMAMKGHLTGEVADPDQLDFPGDPIQGGTGSSRWTICPTARMAGSPSRRATRTPCASLPLCSSRPWKPLWPSALTIRRSWRRLPLWFTTTLRWRRSRASAEWRPATMLEVGEHGGSAARSRHLRRGRATPGTGTWPSARGKKKGEQQQRATAGSSLRKEGQQGGCPLTSELSAVPRSADRSDVTDRGSSCDKRDVSTG